MSKKKPKVKKPVEVEEEPVEVVEYDPQYSPEMKAKIALAKKEEPT